MRQLLTIIFVIASVASYDAANSTEEVEILKSRVAKLEQFIASSSTYCSIHAKGKCGPCMCKDDFNLPKKYYCDCQNQPAMRDCLEFYTNGYKVDGIYKITMNGYRTTQVFCDQRNRYGGGWTVIQRRMDGSTNFFRDWQTYKVGFGQLHREFWLGNDNIHLLTEQSKPKVSEAMIEMRLFGVSYTFYNRYTHFKVDNERSKYMLHVSGGSGGFFPFYLETYNNKQKFSTYNNDNDGASDYNCARDYLYGGWWYNGGGNNCTSSKPGSTNLNGPYDRFRTLDWHQKINWRGHQLQVSEIKIRRLL